MTAVKCVFINASRPPHVYGHVHIIWCLRLDLEVQRSRGIKGGEIELQFSSAISLFGNNVYVSMQSKPFFSVGIMLPIHSLFVSDVHVFQPQMQFESHNLFV